MWITFIYLVLRSTFFQYKFINFNCTVFTMEEVYLDLKCKLEELGYHNNLSMESVPLVECILADLLQTTRSLQHYMDLSKDALLQRDSLLMEAEPYKCENAKLIQENNNLHKEIMHLKEQYLKVSKDLSRKMKFFSEELASKDTMISKLKYDIRDLSLRGLCAETLSSRNRSRKKSEIDGNIRMCACKVDEMSNLDKDLSELKSKLNSLQQNNDMYIDEINLLKTQVEHRDNEIVRLNILLQGGRPATAIKKDYCDFNCHSKIQELQKQINELGSTNNLLKLEIETRLEKQHEAMVRALNLADKNKKLQEELQKVDTLALKVEEDCNKKLSTMTSDIIYLQTRIEGLKLKNSELQKQLSQQTSKPSLSIQEIQETLDKTLKERDNLIVEVRDLIELNKTLQNKIETSQHTAHSQECLRKKNDLCNKNCPTKEELEILFENERKKYEKHIADIEEKLQEAVNLLKTKIDKSGNTNIPTELITSNQHSFIRDLHNRLCESEQNKLLLIKENCDLKAKLDSYKRGDNNAYKDIISQLNAENAELSKENISLSQQLNKLKLLDTSDKSNTIGDHFKNEYNKIKEELQKLNKQLSLVQKDKQEYMSRYKEASKTVENLKRDLIIKQNQIEQLQEENGSYKMTNQTGKASVDHLRDECNFLREEIKKMQTDIIKEKTLANQIKNIQVETERSSNEIQNELFSLQKKLSLSKDKIDMLEKKNKDLQAELISLQSDKSNLMDNIKKLDENRDKLVIELDHKAESINVLEQKIQSQCFEISKLDSEITELKRQLNLNKVSEHKLVDFESQITFLNGEISRITQKYDNAIIENKHLQNSLADTNGTLKLIKIEYEKSRKEVDSLKQQLQHYVAEIRRIEELLSHKETERSDMLEQFASLSVEANILENTNHSLESESATKSMQLQTYITKIQELEANIVAKDDIIDSQSARIASLTCKVKALESEIKLITEEKIIIEQNVSYLKKMCNNLQLENVDKSKGLCETDSELKLYENRIKSLSSVKTKLEEDKNEMREKLMTTETLLSNARKEIVDLKLALQDATSETKSLRERINQLISKDSEHNETTMKELELPLMLEETIHEVSHEEDEDTSRFHEIHKRFSKYSHGGTF